MSEQHESYLERAAASQAQADAQVLDNVRQKHLTSAATWNALAHATTRMEALRARRLSERAAANPQAPSAVRVRAVRHSSPPVDVITRS